MSAILPGFNLLRLARAGAGARGIAINVIAAAAITALAWSLYLATGTGAQWIALGIGVYAAFSWAQNLAYSDPAAFGMIFKSKTIMFSAVGFPSIAFVSYGTGFWGPPFFQRVHEVSAAEAGTVLGLSAAIGGWFGVTAGGVIADKLRAKHVLAKLWVGMASILLSAPLALWLLTTDDLIMAYVANFLLSVTVPLWIGPAASTINDLVLPRMRAIASAFYILMVTFIGLALGPYTMGQISDTALAGGATPAEALREGMLSGLIMLGLALVALILAAMNLKHDEATRLDRARALGEPV